ncbi:hypothetical protein Ae201684P_009366 [Aphanomyces euteiches]|nr:hypothetical protein Ae201684P_009366 [Aphanomyces euteiches]
MAVDDDALNKGNINDEVAMRKAKKAEYNNRTREKKRQALLDEVDKAEYKNRTHKKKRSDIVEDFDKEVAVKRSKKAEYNKRAREKKRNTDVANQGQDAIVLHHTDMDQSNEEESKEGEDGFHYHAQSDHHLKLLAAQEQEDHERRVDNRRIYDALQPNRMKGGGEEETEEENISDGNADCNNDNQLLALANADPPLNMDVNLIDVPPLSLGINPRVARRRRVLTTVGASRSICPHCEAKIWPGEEKDCCDSGARVLPVATWPDTPEFREYIDLFKTRGFVNNARRYNALFAFTSIGTKEIIHGNGGPRSYTIQDKLHHSIGPLLPADEEQASYAQIYITDPETQASIRRTMLGGNLNQSTVTKIQHLLLQHNAFTQLYKHAKDIPKDDDMRLVLTA